MPRFLIVDDSRVARMTVKRCLEILIPEGCIFDEASNGLQALAFLEKTRVDAVITDFLMPDLDGKGLLSRLKADANLSSIPVYVVTSLGVPGLEKELMELGAAGIISKPISPDKFLCSLKGIIQKEENS